MHISLNVIFGFGLLWWPILAFGAIMATGGIGLSGGGDLLMPVSLFALWTYPITYLGGFLINFFIEDTDENWSKKNNIAFLPLINIILFFAPMGLMKFF